MITITATSLPRECKTEVSIDVDATRSDLVNEIRAIILELHNNYGLETMVAMCSIVDDIEGK